MTDTTTNDPPKPLLDFVNNPDNIKKAAEGSMEKRQAVFDRAEPTTDSLRERLRNIRIATLIDESEWTFNVEELVAFFLQDRKRLIERLEAEAVGEGDDQSIDDVTDVENNLRHEIRQRIDIVKQDELQGGGE